MKRETILSQLVVVANQKTREKEFWLKKLSGELTKSCFPYASHDHSPYREEEAAESPRRTVGFRFPPGQCSALMKLCAGSDVKLHMVLAAALAALLEKYTPNRHNDIIIGTPIYKQERQGEYINTVLPLRLRVNTGGSFKELILHTRQTMMEAVENQSYPIEVLLDELGMEFSTTDFPLFDTALLLENIQDKKDIRHIPVNLLFTFSRRGKIIAVSVDYNPLRCEKAAVEQIAGHLGQLVDRVLAGMDSPLAGIDILPGKEKERLLESFNNTRQEYPRGLTIHRWFEQQVERTPDHTAVTDAGESMTYRRLNETSNQLARELRARGVGCGTIAGILLGPSVDLPVGILAVLKAGGAYLPIDPQYPEERVLSILNDGSVSFLLTTGTIARGFSFAALENMNAGPIKPVVTEPRGQITDLDRLPRPDRTLIDYRKYHQYIGIAPAKHTVTIQATRGCPYNCAYCHKIWPKRHVFRSAENIFQEIKTCYDAGVKRFVFIDDIFNLRKDNSRRFMEKIIREGLKIQMFFPNGLRGDILSKDFIDLMIQAGTVDITLALETASPRLQKLISKNLDLEKFAENLDYIIEKYPRVILEMELMIGFPTETEEEALVTLDFLKKRKWIHFPNLHILKIYPNTDMYRLAVENGVSREAIERSSSRAYHELPETLPFSGNFVRQYQAAFLNDYFLSRERLLNVLRSQVKILTGDELVQKYDSYLPAEINSFQDFLRVVGISAEELGGAELALVPDTVMAAPGFGRALEKRRPAKKKNAGAFRVLLLDLSQFFSRDSKDMLYDVAEEPLGLMYLATYLDETFGPRVEGRVMKSRIDFDGFEELELLLLDFKPHLIGIRTLSYHKVFFHKAAAAIRQWGVTVPIAAGGPYATSDYNLLLGDANVDLAVLGEGELTLAHLVQEMMANHNKLPAEEVLKKIPGIAFVTADRRSRLRRTRREVLLVDNTGETAAKHPAGNLDISSQPGDPLYLISTSGSTGRPKSAVLEHRNLVNLLHFEFSKTAVDFSRVLQFASVGFDVSAQELFSTLLWGGTLFPVDNRLKSDVPKLLDFIRDNDVKVLFLPPAFLKYVFSEPGYVGRFPRCVGHIIAAGEQLVVKEPLRTYLKENRVKLHNHYGPSETHVVTALTIDPAGPIHEQPAIGFPISNTRIYILDENQNLKPAGAVGELYISGIGVGRGYSNRVELTGEKYLNDPFAPGERMFRTGDLARWLPGGTIQFLGRADYQIKIRGYRIEPGEIERRLLKDDDIKEAVVMDREDRYGERYLCAYIVPMEKAGVEPGKLRERLSGYLPGYMVPAYFVTMTRIPLTANGKVDRKALPPPELLAGEEYVPYLPPGDEVEKKLAALWADVLGIREDRIGVHANFFQLGGHSLKAVILISKLHKAFNVQLSLGEIFNVSTIRGLAETIKAALPHRHVPIEPAEKKEYFRLSSAQQRFYLIQQMDPESTAYNMSAVVRLEGTLDKKRLTRTFKKLIRAHESLRTSFQLVNEVPVQRIHEDVDFEIEYPAVDHFTRPFDLSRAPLLRVGLIKTRQENHLLMLDMHHIVTDGTSVDIFIKEFTALYEGKELPAPGPQYKDFSEWQNRLFDSGEIREQEEYWLGAFRDGVPVLNLPADFPRPGLRSFEGGLVKQRLDRKTTAALKKLALDEEMTLSMVLFALFNILLAKLSGQEDIVVGVTVSGRRHADLERVIGIFINMLAMRNFPRSHRVFDDFLREVKKRTLDAFENQDYPFEKLVEKVAPNRHTGRNPLFDVEFVLQVEHNAAAAVSEIAIPGLALKTYEYDKMMSNFDLFLFVVDSEEEILLNLQYWSKLFKKETVERFLDCYVRITEQVINHPGIKIGDIDVMDEAERDKMRSVIRENRETVNIDFEF